EATADLAWTLILGTARRIIEGDHMARSGDWTGWAPTQLLGIDLQSKVLGIVGMGRIGRAVARRAAGFGMRLIYYNRHRLPVRMEKRLQASYRPLRALIRSSDVISLHLPLTPQTHHLIGRASLSAMKPGVLLINTARGPVVDEKALITALRTGKIGGAGLDVFEREPVIEKGLRSLQNTVLLPHLGSATNETRIRMGWMAIENIRAVLSGRPAPNQVKYI
ncbi:MAG TPA: D-glycerate dehydrogenase, partial [Nitrospiria bacterium]